MNNSTLRTTEQLLKDFSRGNVVDHHSRIGFVLKEDTGQDVYNITAPFETPSGRYIAGRVEQRDSEFSEIGFFKEEGDCWRQVETKVSLALQDPFVAFIRGELVLGGVEVFWQDQQEKILGYRTVFLKGQDIFNLERFATGPTGMKDIRLLELPSGEILMMTRPQGAVGGRGTIGYGVIPGLYHLNEKEILSATLLKEQFIEAEWGGANQLHLLKNGKIGVLSHIARFGESGERHYHATAFCFDKETGRYSPLKLIAVRKNFAPGPAKRPDLLDVVFSGGMVRLPGNMAALYCGVSDAEGHKILIPDPFLEYEQENCGC